MSWCIAAAEGKGYLDEARPMVEPKTVAAFHRRGLRTLDRGQVARAIEDLSAAHRMNPKSPDILAHRALAYRARKDYELAHDDIAEALKVPVGTVKARLFRARRMLREAMDAGGTRP